MQVRFADLWGNFRAAEALPLVVELTIGWRALQHSVPWNPAARAQSQCWCWGLRLLFG